MKRKSLILLLPALLLSSCGNDPLALPNPGKEVSKEEVEKNFEEAIEPVKESGLIGFEIKDAYCKASLITSSTNIPMGGGQSGSVKTTMNIDYSEINVRGSLGGFNQEDSSKLKADLVASGKFTSNQEREILGGVSRSSSDSKLDAKFYVRENMVYIYNQSPFAKLPLTQGNLPTIDFDASIDFTQVFGDEASYKDHGNGTYSVSSSLTNETIDNLLKNSAKEQYEQLKDALHYDIKKAETVFLFNAQGPLSLGLDLDLTADMSVQGDAISSSKSEFSLQSKFKISFLTADKVLFDEVDPSLYPDSSSTLR